MKIAVFEAENWWMPAQPPGAQDIDIITTDEPLTACNAAKYADVDIACVFIRSEVDKSVIDRMHALRCIVTRSTGHDHIDKVTCGRRSITVSNVPSYGDPTIAEHAFGLILTISRCMREATARTRAMNFSFEGLRGFDLSGRTLGVLGTGAIGSSMIRIARGFGMRVMATDIEPDTDLARQLDFTYTPLENLLACSDIVSLHVPLSPATRNLISDASFDAMKDGVVLINTARGEVVDTAALLASLKSGKVAAAGLDVFADENLLRQPLIDGANLTDQQAETLRMNKELLSLDNVIATPHSAFNTREALDRINEITLGNILAFKDGSPANCV